MSDTRRAARALVERRSERFESRHDCEEAQRRLAQALAAVGPTPRVAFASAWHAHAGGCVLEATFEPSRGALRTLRVLSVAMLLLVVAAALAWWLPPERGTLGYAMAIFTLLAVLGMPIVTLGLGSQREADEARIRKAIRVALLDEEPGYPPRRRWDDDEEE